jgi:hypothetical protein
MIVNIGKAVFADTGPTSGEHVGILYKWPSGHAARCGYALDSILHYQSARGLHSAEVATLGESLRAE